MSTTKKHAIPLCFAAILSLASIETACAQSSTTDDSGCTPKQAAAKVAAPASVQPIKRVKKPAKPIAADWTTMASTYTHDQNGQRVDQYALAVEPLSNERADFVRSGYRSTRSTLQAGFSSDHYHVTEQWGGGVQPYGQWRYPYRPFGVPYGQWGPQLPQVVGGGMPWGFPNPMFRNGVPMNPGFNNGGNPAAVPGMAVPGMGAPGMAVPGNGNMFPNPGNPFGGNQQPFGFGPNGFGVGPSNALPASQDEYYQQAPSLRVPGAQPFSGFFQSPNN